MINIDKTLDKDHIVKIVGNDINRQAIFEKYVHSMILLEQLDYLLKGKEYLFKGGTSLLLHFGDSSRFSIDVDISMLESEYDNRAWLEEHFKNNISKQFVNVTMDDKRSHSGRDIKCAHYYFYYQPRYQTDEPYVLLDIVFQDVIADKTKIYVDNPRVIQEGDKKLINIISVDSLLGDKLTAFAPNTVGIKYTSNNHHQKPKECEIVKQLFDCAYLCDKYADINDVLATYKSVCQYQSDILPPLIEVGASCSSSLLGPA